MFMTSMIRLHSALAIVLTAVAPCGTGEGPPSRVQVVRAGKAATALVDVKAQGGWGYGSAFCAQPGERFVTNAHVVVADATLVLNPNLKNEKC
jgi:hypothetical protein